MIHAIRYRHLMSWLPRSALIGAVVIAPVVGCEEDASGPVVRDGVAYGAAITLGDGTARTFVVMGRGVPAELGVALSEKALDDLPEGDGPHGGHHEYLLPLPAEAASLPFKLVELGWNPRGHEPEGIYTVPHFDTHFYTITNAERVAIDPADPQFDRKAARFPAQRYIPATYFAPEPVAVPRMGVHWLDPKAPELNGKPFTATFIYGSWDGKLIFAEPMYTVEFLRTRPNFRAAVPVARKYAPAGLYPNEYRIYWEAGAKEYRIAISGLARRG